MILTIFTFFLSGSTQILEMVKLFDYVKISEKSVHRIWL